MRFLSAVEMMELAAVYFATGSSNTVIQAEHVNRSGVMSGRIQ
jgi:hypothetical protein